MEVCVNGDNGTNLQGTNPYPHMLHGMGIFPLVHVAIFYLSSR